MQENVVRFPTLIRFNRDQHSPKRMQRSLETKKNYESFKITDLKIYEKKLKRVSPPPDLDYRESSILREKESLKISTDASVSKTDILYTLQTKIQDRKINSQTMFDLLSQSIKDFFTNRQDVLKIFDDFSIIYEQMNHLITNIKCYKFEVGAALERMPSMFFKIIEKLLDQNIKYYNQSQLAWQASLEQKDSLIDQLKKEQKQWAEKQIQYDKAIKYRECEYEILKASNDSLQNEVILLHELIKKDIIEMQLKIDSLQQTRIENAEKEAVLSDSPSDRLISDLAHVQRILAKIDTEQSDSSNFINTMDGILRGMIKGQKRDQYTQLDEGELTIPIEQMLKSKFKDLDLFQEDESVVQNQTVTPWRVPNIMILFMNNVIKDKENGRVMPWNSFRMQIYQIYQERVQDSSFIFQSLGNNVPFEEYICLSLLRKHSIRKVAEVKLLEFLVSIKYYLKTNIRAQTMAKLIGLIPIMNNVNENSPIDQQLAYKLDGYLVQYFLYCFQKMTELKELVQEQNASGVTYINYTRAIDIFEQLLPFAQDQQKIKLRKKMDQHIIKYKNSQVIDFDQYLAWLLAEFLESRRGQIKILQKTFSKELDNEVCDIEDYFYIVELTQERIFSYRNNFVKLRACFNALTQPPNSIKITETQFLVSCSQYGLDSPFNIYFVQKMNEFHPRSTLESPYPSDLSAIKAIFQKIDREPQRSITKKRSVLVPKSKSGNRDASFVTSKEDAISQLSDQIHENEDRFKEEKSKDEKPPPQKEQDKQQLYPISKDQSIQIINGQFKILSQHLTIIKELRVTCSQLQQQLDKEKNVENMIQIFQNIQKILDAACTFFNFPTS